MIIIEIDSTNVSQKGYTDKKTGEQKTMTFQQIVITGHMVDGFPAKLGRESTIMLEDKNPQPHPVGKYVIDQAASFYFGDFGRFNFGRMKLQPLAAFMAEIKKQFAAPDLKAA